MTGRWQSSANAAELVELLGSGVSPRKVGLLGVACCRRLAAFNWFDETRQALHAAEMRVDGQVADSAVATAYGVVYERREAAGRMILGDPDADEPNDGTAAYFLIDAVLSLLAQALPLARVGTTLALCRRAVGHGLRSRHQDLVHHESEAQCELIRDIFGDPFRPVAFDPAWRTEAVVALARGMYEARDFAPMSVLADALDDAGCADADVLAHCRGPGPHVRGCWVADLVLGKA